MLREIGIALAERMRHWIPEPFVFALGLTALMALLALGYTDTGANQVIGFWYKGFFNLLEFTMQIVLMLASGYAIALSPPVMRLIDKVAVRASTPLSVYIITIVVGGLFSLVSWSWVVLTSVLARELAKRVDGVDYAFLVACAYFSSTPWVMGLSSSIPLVLNTEGNFLIEAGVLSETIPAGVTLSGWLNWLFLLVYFVTIPLLMSALCPHDKHAKSLTALGDPAATETGTVKEEAEAETLTGTALSDRLNNGITLQMVVGLCGLWYGVWHFYTRGFDLNLNIMIFLFFSVGLLAHRTPMRYVVAMRRSCTNISGIVFQYPFYAGIMGIMMYSGMATMVSDWMVSFASIHTLPLVAQFAGAAVNFAIPSAGGEWAVVGPTFMQAAQDMATGMSAESSQAFLSRIAMSVAVGETLTNALQPFFLLLVLPVMGAGVKIAARDVMGYLVLPFAYLYLASALLLVFAPL